MPKGVRQRSAPLRQGTLSLSPAGRGLGWGIPAIGKCPVVLTLTFSRRERDGRGLASQDADACLVCGDDLQKLESSVYTAVAVDLR
jgi:hypothetical protein